MCKCFGKRYTTKETETITSETMVMHRRVLIDAQFTHIRYTYLGVILERQWEMASLWNVFPCSWNGVPCHTEILQYL